MAEQPVTLTTLINGIQIIDMNEDELRALLAHEDERAVQTRTNLHPCYDFCKDYLAGLEAAKHDFLQGDIDPRARTAIHENVEFQTRVESLVKDYIRKDSMVTIDDTLNSDAVQREVEKPMEQPVDSSTENPPFNVSLGDLPAGVSPSILNSRRSSHPSPVSEFLDKELETGSSEDFDGDAESEYDFDLDSNDEQEPAVVQQEEDSASERIYGFTVSEVAMLLAESHQKKLLRLQSYALPSGQLSRSLKPRRGRKTKTLPPTDDEYLKKLSETPRKPVKAQMEDSEVALQYLPVFLEKVKSQYRSSTASPTTRQEKIDTIAEMRSRNKAIYDLFEREVTREVGR